jgi:hypothetical protein
MDTLPTSGDETNRLNTRRKDILRRPGGLDSESECSENAPGDDGGADRDENRERDDEADLLGEADRRRQPEPGWAIRKEDCPHEISKEGPLEASFVVGSSCRK